MKHIYFLSYGKDSMAQLILAWTNNQPIDAVVYVDIKFDNETSGENPVLANWIPEAKQKIKEWFGLEVITLTANTTFKDCFYRTKQKGNHVGDIYGFPFIVSAWCNSRLKLDVISRYIKELRATGETIVEHVGIAIDEPERLERLRAKSNDKIIYESTLAEFNYTEAQAYNLCKTVGLLSPHYEEEESFRGGCWFCVKQNMKNLRTLCVKYPHLYAELEAMERDSHTPFKPNFSLKAFREKIEQEKNND